MSKGFLEPWEAEKWKPIHIHRAMDAGRDLSGFVRECDWKDACVMAAAPAMYALLRELGGEGGDGFCKGCGRMTAGGAPHSEACQIAVILEYVDVKP